MRQINHRGRRLAGLALVGALWWSGACWGQAADVSADLAAMKAQLAQQQQLLDQQRQQIAQQRQDLDRLARSTAQANAADMNKVSATVLADAQSRSAGIVGYREGFYFGPGDGKSVLKVNGVIQTRYVYNHADQAANTDDLEGFQMRRIQLGVNGSVFNPQLTYQILGAFNRGSGNLMLENAWAAYAFNDNWQLRGGAFQIPFLREGLVSASRNLAVESSLVRNYFDTDNADGVQLAWAKDDWRISLAVHDGSYSRETEFSRDSTTVAVAGRAEYLAAGSWDQFKDFTGWSDSKWAMMLGAAIDYEVGNNNGTVIGDDILKYTVDANLKGPGWNLMAALVGQHLQDNTGTGGNADQLGALVQGGVFVLPGTVEVFGRYEYLYLNGVYYMPGQTAITNIPTDHSRIDIITAGVNYYFIKHNAKLTCDVMYVCDPLVASVENMGLVASGKAGELVLRVQFQLMF